MSEIKHIPLPYKPSYHGQICIGVQNGDFYGQMICNTILPETDDEYEKQKVEIEGTAEFIAEACNNYYKLKEQNDKLKEALEKIQNPVMYLQKQAQASGSKLDGLMAVALSKDCEWLKGIEFEALKSCES